MVDTPKFLLKITGQDLKHRPLSIFNYNFTLKWHFFRPNPFIELYQNGKFLYKTDWEPASINPKFSSFRVEGLDLDNYVDVKIYDYRNGSGLFGKKSSRAKGKQGKPILKGTGFFKPMNLKEGQSLRVRLYDAENTHEQVGFLLVETKILGQLVRPPRKYTRKKVERSKSEVKYRPKYSTKQAPQRPITPILSPSRPERPPVFMQRPPSSTYSSARWVVPFTSPQSRYSYQRRTKSAIYNDRFGQNANQSNFDTLKKEEISKMVFEETYKSYRENKGNLLDKYINDISTFSDKEFRSSRYIYDWPDPPRLE